ncbi:purine-cytosine permease family protein [Streptomyces rugosispiralis]|uniref:Cytosine permease n=1 Tax=Streptomyces rugosispiralis TaxID=2967341 RepID=A0ABT1UWY1_9ACTN|nr:cytosine permease [Streptomyces rugosispiralis]MCQ8189638.1 cytosine permease [Streptomyces rugosispiralis]
MSNDTGGPRQDPAPTPGQDPAPTLEQHGIEHIPAAERHGKPWHQLTLWFSSNVQMTAVVTGAVAVTLGLDLTWAIATIVVGNLVGGVFMAYHSVQGPELGVPQMIQSRAQFGFLGGALPSFIVVLMYLGFSVEGGLVGGGALAGWTGIPKPTGIVIFCVLHLLVALVGYKLIHATARVISVLSGIVFLALFVQLATHLPAHLPNSGSPATPGTVLLAVSISISWQVTWAPYVSDYSRYLPEDTPRGTTFWYTYLGSAVGGTLTMVIGAMAAAINDKALNADAIGFLADRYPAISGLVVFALLMSMIPAGAEGAYGAFLSTLSIFSRKDSLRSPALARALFVIGFTLVGAVLAILSSGSMITTYTNITLFLLYLLIPWTAINLTDYYFVRRGHYDISALFEPDGRYGRCNWGTVILYAVSIAAELPFVNSSLYVGPLVEPLGGADIAWLVGLVVGAVGYYALARVSRGGGAELEAPLPQPRVPF